jgi:formate-dependent nitrite reductase membrane component NrfD
MALDLLTPLASREAGLLIVSHDRAGTGRRRPGLLHTSYCPQPAWRPLFMPGFQVAVATLMLAALCLAFDLGRPTHLLRLFTHPTASHLTVGSYALCAAIVSGLTVAILWSSPTLRLPRLLVRTLEGLGLLAAAAVMLYTGLLLQSIGTGLLLGTVLLPVLFVLSALSCGLALLSVTTSLTDAEGTFARTLGQLAFLDALLIGAELLALALLIGTALEQTGPSQAARALIQGDFAPAFWTGVVACGLCAPLILGRLRPRFVKPPRLAAALMVLVGGFALRWCLVTAGLPVFAPGSV